MIDRRLASRGLILVAIGFPLLCAAGTFLVEGWPGRRYLLFYLAPIGSAFALWLRLRLLERRGPPRARLLDGAVVALAALRFAGGIIPASGHMLFFTYSGLTTGSGWYRALALVLALETTYFKLIVWGDPRSWGLGIAGGIAATLLHRTLLREPFPGT